MMRVNHLRMILTFRTFIAESAYFSSQLERADGSWPRSDLLPSGQHRQHAHGLAGGPGGGEEL